MSRIRIGIVGVGMAGAFHVECLRRVYGVEVEIAGVTSLRPERRQQFGERHGIPVYNDIESMLDHIDILDICSPPSAHKESMLLAAAAGKHLIVEKPLTGYFGENGDDSFRGNTASKAMMLEQVMATLDDIARAIPPGLCVGYAENFVYGPAIQKERQVLEQSKGQILRMLGEESHNGSHSPVYGIWKFGGGGSLIGKGCHPLTALLYLKRCEGLIRTGAPVRPKTVTARTHELTRLPSFDDRKFIRSEYTDIEDCGWMHVEFEDGTVGDVVTSEVVLGGIYDYVEVFANNHRARCRLSPTNLVDLYAPSGHEMGDLYIMEKLSSREGWANAAPDENWTMGYQLEIQDFIECAITGRHPQSDLGLAIDTTATIYTAYLSAERRGAEVEIPLLPDTTGGK